MDRTLIELTCPLGTFKIKPVTFERVLLDGDELTVGQATLYVSGLVFRGWERGPENDGEGWTAVHNYIEPDKYRPQEPGTLVRGRGLYFSRKDGPFSARHDEGTPTMQRKITAAVLAAVGEWADTADGERALNTADASWWAQETRLQADRTHAAADALQAEQEKLRALERRARAAQNALRAYA